MAQSASAEKRAREEAAAWFTRLSHRSVPLQALEEFRAWRQDPANLAAYRAMESIVRGADTLKNDAEIGAALAAALARPRLTQTRRGSLWPIGAIVTAGLAVMGGWALVRLIASPTYATHVGEQRVVRLSDGTLVRLDTDTKLAVRFDGADRRVQLDHGQAFFNVAHDPVHPFIVNAGAMQVRAVGTRFDVRREGVDAKVTLVEGIVQVRRTGQQPIAWTLKPGQQVNLGRASTPSPADLAAATSWTTGRVVFRGLPLAQAIDEINRYTPHKIRLAAQGVGGVPVTGSFDTGDTNAFVSAVSDLHGLIAKTSPDGTIVLDESPPRGA